jgi:sulfate transport system permease protein
MLASPSRARSGAPKLALRTAVLAYLALILVLPVGAVVRRTLGAGIGPVWHAITTPDALHALYLTILVAAITVPLNTLFGVACAVVLVRQRFPGRKVLDAVVDLPFAVSPAVIGLALILVYGDRGWFGGWLTAHGLQVIFSLPGMVLATVFVSLPYVVREVTPVLREVGEEQEEAARTLGTSPIGAFMRLTLPSIRWGLAYGVTLTTARALGEFGAVAIVSGRLVGQTETMTLFVENRFEGFDQAGAYGGALVLAALALLVLLGMTRLRRGRGAPPAAEKEKR